MPAQDESGPSPGGGPKGRVSSKGPTRYDAIVAEANRLDGVGAPYNNARPPSDDAGYDCSSTCADLMIAAGYKVDYFNTCSAKDVMKTGKDPTNRVTFWNNDHNCVTGNGVHMFAEIGGRFFGTSSSNPGGGPGWLDDGYSTSGFDPYHIEGLDQPADLPANADTSINGGSGGGGGGSGADPEAIAKAAAISAFLNFPALQISAESMALTGDRSLMNDQQLLPFIEQLCLASLRNFQSMPDGTFFAFFPDYFGGLNHRTPYWEISDMEIISGQIDLSDDSLATHVYVVGDTSTFDGQIDIVDKINSAGIVTVFTAFMADFLNGVSSPVLQDKKKGEKDTKKAQKQYDKEIDQIPSLAQKDRAITFLEKYGARPYFEDVPYIRTPFFEKFLAYQKFCLLWSRQFLTTFEFTFMPELFPGGIVSFPEHGIQCYIDEVVHECDYQNGFVTRANLSAPAAIKDQNGIRRGPRQYVHEGMIRGSLFVEAASGGKPSNDHRGN